MNQLISTIVDKSRCPCRDSTGHLFIQGAVDYGNNVPGEWDFNRCQRCDSLWIAPPPLATDIPSFYPSSYSFIRANPTNTLIKEGGLAHQVKLSILANAYGYSDLRTRVTSIFASGLGVVLSRFERMKRKAGFATRFLNYKAGGHLLDIGCGNGGFLRQMNDLGWRAEGLEPDPEAVRVAREAGLVVTHGTIENCDLPAQTYDAITMHHVLEHLVDLKTAVRRVAVSLKTGGVFVSISPNPMGLLARWFGREWRALDAPRHLALPTVEGYRRLLNDLGFSLELFTSMRVGYWVLCESMCIKERGKLEANVNAFKSRMLQGFAVSTMGLRPDLGEEVICVATKQK